MGLVWSAYGDGTSYAISLRTQPLFITAETGSETANIEVSRTLLTDEIACTDIRERGLYGRFFRPATGGPVPGVLVLGGSEGGLASYVMREAALLAGHGFAALALAYFYMGSLPDRLAGIPLEYFGGAIRWLQNQLFVRGDRLGVVGTSRGGELALLLGAHFQIWRATPPPTKIPGDACSACSMDVCGADVFASSVKQALREGDVDRDRHGCQDHAEDQQLSQEFTPSTAARGRALAESRASRTGRPRRQGLHGYPSRRRCRLRSRGSNLRC
jgi:BAAT / Acyl-CoA thioester hydrolase C terminal